MTERKDTEDSRGDTAGEQPSADVPVLEQALWTRLDSESNLVEFIRTWLALLVRQTGPLKEAVVVLETTKGDGFVPIARWPVQQSPDPDLARAIEAALEREAGAMSGARAAAEPLIVDGELIGAVGIVPVNPQDEPAVELRRLRWHLGWIIAAVRRELAVAGKRDVAKMSLLVDLVGTIADAGDFRPACHAAVNHLARGLDCTQVALGFVRRRKVRVATLSDVADFRMDTSMTERMRRAMAEAADQDGSILHPARIGQSYMVALAHEELVQSARLGDVLTVPLYAGEKMVGILHFQKAQDKVFADGEIMAAEAAGATLGLLLQDKRKADRSFLRAAWDAGTTQLVRILGPGYLFRKIALLAIAAMVVFFSFAETDFRISAQAEIEGQIIRSIVAPFDGHVYTERARAGDVVRSGQALASLDVRDLELELLRWRTDLDRFTGEYDRALATRDAPTSRIAMANIEQALAKTELVTLQIARAEMDAPFDAIVIRGDLSRSLGAAVARGDELFQIAPLDEFRVVLEVEEADFAQIEIGQMGTLILASLPEEKFKFEITQITPSMQADGGRNFAIVEALLMDSDSTLRPGMRGVAKVTVEKRRLIDVWTRPLIDWGRLALWRWLP